MKAAIALLSGWALIGSSAADVQVITHLVEIPQARLSELLATTPAGGAFFDRIREEVKAGGAKTVDTSLLRLPMGGKALLESISEVIYPSEYEPPDLGPSQPPEKLIWRWPALHLPMVPPAFETRNSGLTLEVDIGRSKKGVPEVQLDWNWTSYPADTVFTDWTDGRMRHIERKPSFVTLQTESQFVFAPGKWLLAGSFSPHDAAGKIDLSRKLLLFVRVDELQ